MPPAARSSWRRVRDAPFSVNPSDEDISVCLHGCKLDAVLMLLPTPSPSRALRPLPRPLSDAERGEAHPALRERGEAPTPAPPPRCGRGEAPFQDTWGLL